MGMAYHSASYWQYWRKCGSEQNVTLTFRPFFNQNETV
jgi:hypothetical protein